MTAKGQFEFDAWSGLQAVGQAVVVTDTSGCIRFWNAAAEQLYGWAAEEVLDKSVLDVTPADHSAVDAREIMEALLAGEAWTGEMVLRRRDGSTFLARVVDTPIVNAEGQLAGIIGVSQDITRVRAADNERRRGELERARLLASESAARAAAEAAKERLSFLAYATTALGEAATLQERLDRLARVSVPRFGAGCAVHMVNDAGHIALVAVHHVDGDAEHRLRAALEQWPAGSDASGGPLTAIQEGRSCWVRDLADGLFSGDFQDAQQHATLRSLDIAAGLSVPLRGRKSPVGAITFFPVGAGGFDEQDVQLAEELCARIGVLIENAQLAEANERDRLEQLYQAALLRALYEASVDGIIVVDPQGRVLSSNQRFTDMWGFDPELVAAGDDAALLRDAMRKVTEPEKFLARVEALYAEATTSARDEVQLSDGRTLDRHGTPLYGENGQQLGWAWSFRDITTERRQQAELAAASERFAMLARTLQNNLLPPRLPTPDGIELAARYHPALEGMEVGGDFYDVFASRDDWTVVLGDVCGKGAQAAQMTGLVRWTVRGAATHSDDPVNVLNELNTVLLTDDDVLDDGRFATVCCMRLRRETADVLSATVVCAGHPAPLVLRRDGTVEYLSTAGMPVGLFSDIDLEPVTARLGPGDSLIALTDGVLEARDAAGHQLGESGVLDLLTGRRDATAAHLSDVIATTALGHVGGVARDDIAVLVVTARASVDDARATSSTS